MTTHNSAGQLSNRRLVPFLIGTALGNAGDIFTQIAVFWTGLSITGTALSVAGLGGIWTIGSAIAGLVSGPIVDRFNRRNILVVAHLLLSVLCFVVFAFSVSGALQMWHLWVFLIGESILGTPVSAAFNSLLPDIVPKDRLVRVYGLLSSWGMGDNLIEAFFSGAVLALWGPAPIFLFNGVMYVVGAAAALCVPERAGSPQSRFMMDRWRPLEEFRFALRYVYRERILRRVLALSFLSSLVFAPLFFIAPIVVDAMGKGPAYYSYFQTLTLVGVLSGSLIASSVGANWPKVPMWVGGTTLFALSFLALGIHLTPATALVVFFLFGLGVSGGRVYGQTLLQQVLPSSVRGRVNGIREFLGGVLQPASLAIAMLLVDRTGVQGVLIGLALLMLAVAVSYVLLLPLRERQWVLSDV
ncbi:MFS transporter [Candidatus Bipolaricaulota bacterium]|nr:MFS transporter [Candidatus Bipolaricaulota bacterium]